MVGEILVTLLIGLIPILLFSNIIPIGCAEVDKKTKLQSGADRLLQCSILSSNYKDFEDREPRYGKSKRFVYPYDHSCSGAKEVDEKIFEMINELRPSPAQIEQYINEKKGMKLTVTIKDLSLLQTIIILELEIYECTNKEGGEE